MCAGGVSWESRLKRGPRSCPQTRENIPITLLIDPSHVYVYSFWRGLNTTIPDREQMFNEHYRAHSDSVGDCVDVEALSINCKKKNAYFRPYMFIMKACTHKLLKVDKTEQGYVL